MNNNRNCNRMNDSCNSLPRAATGTPGLDFILDGGLARNRLHLLEGSPGAGKTTIALQFLLAGAEIGEAGIYVSLAETEQELRDGAQRSRRACCGKRVFAPISASSSVSF
jgi:predicted ATP-dependent serine protease